MKFLVYSKSNCKYCEYAKELLEEKGVSYKVINVDEILKYNRTEFILSINEKINQSNGKRFNNTFPIIFLEEKYIGGFTDLVCQINHVKLFNEDF